MFVCVLGSDRGGCREDTTTEVGGGGFGFVCGFDCGLVRLGGVCVWFVCVGFGFGSVRVRLVVNRGHHHHGWWWW